LAVTAAAPLTAGQPSDVTVTVTNQGPEATAPGTVSLDEPAGWSAEPVAVPAIEPRAPAAGTPAGPPPPPPPPPRRRPAPRPAAVGAGAGSGPERRGGARGPGPRPRPGPAPPPPPRDRGGARARGLGPVHDRLGRERRQLVGTPVAAGDRRHGDPRAGGLR